MRRSNGPPASGRSFSGLPRRKTRHSTPGLGPPACPPGRRVFQRDLDIDIWRYRIGGVNEPFIVSSSTDSNPQFSPDGSLIAFSSNRGGYAMEIWVANVDGSNPRQVTHGPARCYGSPCWSPDCKWIACDSQGDVERADSPWNPPPRAAGARSNRSTSPLYAKPIAGGAERPVIALVVSRAHPGSEHGTNGLGGRLRRDQYGSDDDRVLPVAVPPFIAPARTGRRPPEAHQ